MNRRTDAIGLVESFLATLTTAGWTVGLGGVTVDPTGSIVFFVNGPPDLLAAAIQETEFSLPHRIEQTDRHGVIYPP